MMAGMIVVRDGEPWTVARMSDLPPAAGIPGKTTYYLQHGQDLAFVENPKASEVPLLPACPSCGKDAQPGQPGSEGWPCAPACPFTHTERAALHALKGSW